MRGEGAAEAWGEFTPLDQASKEVPVRNAYGGQIQAISAWIEEYVQANNWVSNVLDEALAESYTQAERERLTQEQIRAFQYTLLGRALLDVAESCFIHAAGLSDD